MALTSPRPMANQRRLVDALNLQVSLCFINDYGYYMKVIMMDFSESEASRGEDCGRIKVHPKQELSLGLASLLTCARSQKACCQCAGAGLTDLVCATWFKERITYMYIPSDITQHNTDELTYWYLTRSELTQHQCAPCSYAAHTVHVLALP